VTTLIGDARRRAGLTQQRLAQLAHTSRPTLSAYEHGRKSPTLDTLTRLLAAAGQELTTGPRVDFHRAPVGRGRVAYVPNHLPRLPVADALASVALPLHLEWSRPGRVARLGDRRERARAYEVILREGGPDDIRRFVDGALLVDLWDELVLPPAVRDAWAPLVAAARAGDAA